MRAGDAAASILGYTVANDVTARDQQKIDGQWTRAKGYDTFCPLGPWIDTDFDPSDAVIRTELIGLDGQTTVKQQSRTSLMLHSVGEIVEWVSRVMTLLPGDVILTGTPRGHRPDGRRGTRLGDHRGPRHPLEPGGGQMSPHRRGHRPGPPVSAQINGITLSHEDSGGTGDPVVMVMGTGSPGRV